MLLHIVGRGLGQGPADSLWSIKIDRSGEGPWNSHPLINGLVHFVGGLVPSSLESIAHGRTKGGRSIKSEVEG